VTGKLAGLAIFTPRLISVSGYRPARSPCGMMVARTDDSAREPNENWWYFDAPPADVSEAGRDVHETRTSPGPQKPLSPPGLAGLDLARRPGGNFEKLPCTNPPGEWQRPPTMPMCAPSARNRFHRDLHRYDPRRPPREEISSMSPWPVRSLRLAPAPGKHACSAPDRSKEVSPGLPSVPQGAVTNQRYSSTVEPTRDYRGRYQTDPPLGNVRPDESWCTTVRARRPGPGPYSVQSPPTSPPLNSNGVSSRSRSSCRPANNNPRRRLPAQCSPSKGGVYNRTRRTAIRAPHHAANNSRTARTKYVVVVLHTTPRIPRTCRQTRMVPDTIKGFQAPSPAKLCATFEPPRYC